MIKIKDDWDDKPKDLDDLMTESFANDGPYGIFSIEVICNMFTVLPCRYILFSFFFLKAYDSKYLFLSSKENIWIIEHFSIALSYVNSFTMDYTYSPPPAIALHLTSSGI